MSSLKYAGHLRDENHVYYKASLWGENHSFVNLKDVKNKIIIQWELFLPLQDVNDGADVEDVNGDDDYSEAVNDSADGEGVNDDDIDARGGAFELEFGFALDNLSHPVRAENRESSLKR